MLPRQWFNGMLALLVGANVLHAQSVDLTEASLAQQCFRNEVTMELTGKIMVKQGDKETAYPLRVQANQTFLERNLDVNGSVVDKAARFYLAADGSSQFDKSTPNKLALRPERRFLVAQRNKERVVVYSPRGILTREEIDLTDHFDSMAVSGLVPGSAASVGKTWKLPNHVVMALCDVNALTEQNVECTFSSVNGTVAQAKFVGKVQGIDRGAQVVMLINGSFEFDTNLHRVVSVDWRQTDERQQGPVSPAMSADVTIRLKRTPVPVPDDLNDFALVPVPTSPTPPASLTNILYTEKSYQLQYSRDWHMTSAETSPQLVMRLIERGDFLAQVTITPWKQADPKNIKSLAEFAAEVVETPGWKQEKEIDRREFKESERAKGHQKVYRVAVSGELGGVNSWQYFYLIVGSKGEQVVVTFSMVPQHVQRLGGREDELVREIAFP